MGLLGSGEGGMISFGEGVFWDLSGYQLDCGGN
jgi:hypothetical protein